MKIHTVTALKDNLCYMIENQQTRSALVIDPSEADPVLRTLREHDLSLSAILCTHHHHDHVGGIEGLLADQATHSIPVYVSKYDFDQRRISRASRALSDLETVVVDQIEFQTIAIPGHTLGQVAFVFRDLNAVFVGDTLFSLGCGRLFEGTVEQMWQSLKRIVALSETVRTPSLTAAQVPTLGREARLYFGHEYTERNIAFAQSALPATTLVELNEKLQLRLTRTQSELSQSGIATPPTIAEEAAINPFLLIAEPKYRATLSTLFGFGNENDDVVANGRRASFEHEVAVFARLRKLRNGF